MLRWLPLLVIGCSAPAPDGKKATKDNCNRGGVTEVLLLRTLAFPREEDGVTLGFDLDGDVTVPGGLYGCGVGDQVSPDGTEGIDNSFARMRPALDTTEASALDDIVHEAINAGGLLVMVQLDDVEDVYDDACVDLSITTAIGTPMVGSDNLILPAQTLAVDPDSPVSSVQGSEIIDGVLRDGPIDIDLPFKFLDAEAIFHLRYGQILLERQDNGIYTGLIGGGVAIQDLSDLAHNTGIDETVEVLLDSILTFNADLNPDENGVCQDISMTLEFEAVKAFFFEE